MEFNIGKHVVCFFGFIGFILLPDFAASFPYNQQEAEPRFTNQINWSKVNEGLYDPTNVAIHNGQRFINFVSGTVGWIILSFLYTPQVKQVRTFSRNFVYNDASTAEPINEEPSNSWYTYGNQDASSINERLKRSVEHESEEKHPLKDAKLNSFVFDPKTKLVNMIRSFADSVEGFDWQYDEF